MPVKVAENLIEAIDEDLNTTAPISTSSCGNRREKTIGKYQITPRGLATGIGASSRQYLDRAGLPRVGSGLVWGSLASVP